MKFHNYYLSWVFVLLFLGFSFQVYAQPCPTGWRRATVGYTKFASASGATGTYCSDDILFEGVASESFIASNVACAPAGFTSLNNSFYAIMQNVVAGNFTADGNPVINYTPASGGGVYVVNPADSKEIALYKIDGLRAGQTYNVRIVIVGLTNLAGTSWCNNHRLRPNIKINRHNGVSTSGGGLGAGSTRRIKTITQPTGCISDIGDVEWDNNNGGNTTLNPNGHRLEYTCQVTVGGNNGTQWPTDTGFEISFGFSGNDNTVIMGIEEIEVTGCVEQMITVSTGSETVCESDAVTLRAIEIGAVGTNIEWTNVTTGQTVQNSTSRTVTITTPAAASGPVTYRATGNYGSKEITLIPRICCSSAQQAQVFIESFNVGTFNSYGRANVPGLGGANAVTAIGANYIYQPGPDGVNDGMYAVVRSSRDGGYWGHVEQLNERTGTAGSGALLVNATNTQDFFYRRVLDNVCPNTLYEFTAWYASLVVDNRPQAQFDFEIYAGGTLTGGGGTLIERTRVDVDNIGPNGSMPPWLSTSVTFNTGNNPGPFFVQLTNRGGAGNGNDFMIDDITVSKCIPEIHIENGGQRDEITTCSTTGVELEINASQTILDVIAEGSPTGNTVYYQWRESATASGPWTPIGATQALLPSERSTLQTPSYPAGTVRYYQVKIASTQARAEDWSAGSLTDCGNDAMSEIFRIEIMSGAHISSTTPGSRCGTGTVQLTAITSPTGETIDWYDDATDGTLIDSSADGAAWTTPSISTTTTYYAEVRGSSCAASRTAVTATINQIPAAPTVTNASITYCTGAINVPPLTATGTGLLWYTVSSGGTGSATAPTPNTSTAGTTSYWVSQTANGCESARTQIQVEVSDTPVPAQVEPYEKCAVIGTPIGWATLVVTEGTYTWYADETTPTAMTSAPAAFNPNTAQQTSYWVIVTEDNGCRTSRTEVSVTVNALPASTVQLVKNVTCPGGSDGEVALVSVDAGQAPFTYVWKNASGTQVQTNNLSAGIYTLTVTDANNCSANSAPVTVIDTPDTVAPVITPIPSQVANCDFQVPDLRALVRTASSDNCTAQSALTITQSPAVNTVISQNTTVTVTVTDASGNANTIDIMVNILNMPTINFPPIASLCRNDAAITLVASNSDGLPGTFSGTGVNGTTFNPNIAGAGMHTITYTILPHGCTMTETQTVIVNPVPTNIVINAPSVCPEDDLIVTATPSIYARYDWKVNGVPVPSQTGNVFIYDEEKLPEEQIIFEVVAVSSEGCLSNPATVVATINAVPSGITLIPQPVFCVAEFGMRTQWRDLVDAGGHRVLWFETEDSEIEIVPGNIDQSVPGTFTLYAVAISDKGCMSSTVRTPVTVTIHENPRLDNIDTSDLDNIRLTIVGGEKPYIYDIEGVSGNTNGLINLGFMPIGNHILLVIDSNGCELETFVPILEFNLIPDKFFTPNKDRFNNVWTIKNIEKYVDDNVTIHIFDRTGKELFKSDARNFRGWDGTFNGKKLPSTDYWYLITIGRLGQRMTGNFTLKR